eukprot:c4480_g1_i1.p1 GENE.c4480_g1_i1~~c4480_g1_i1.p1  ORF type:complete len:709 (+),score=109.07 c4480_g1_i1:38-2128(+)
MSHEPHAPPTSAVESTRPAMFAPDDSNLSRRRPRSNSASRPSYAADSNSRLYPARTSYTGPIVRSSSSHAARSDQPSHNSFSGPSSRSAFSAMPGRQSFGAPPRRSLSGGPLKRSSSSGILPVDREENLEPNKAAIMRGDSTEEAVESGLSKQDLWNCLGLFILALALRCFRISVPDRPMWREQHVAKLITWYHDGHYFVDTAPPLAALIFWTALKFTPFAKVDTDEQVMRIDHLVSDDWRLLFEPESGNYYYLLRIVSAVAGSLCVCAAYFAARYLNCDQWCSLLTACMLLFDNLMVVQSRLILTDIFFDLFALAALAASFASANEAYPIPKQKGFCALSGALLGCAVSVKFTALGTVGVVLLHQLIAAASTFKSAPGDLAQRFSQAYSMGVSRIVITSLACVAVYVLVWYPHVKALPHHGAGTDLVSEAYKETLWHKLPNGMTAEDACPNHNNAFRECGFPGITPSQCEARGCCYDPSSPGNWCYHKGVYGKTSMGVVRQMWESAAATWRHNHKDQLPNHPHESHWYEWPMMRMRMVPLGTVGFHGRLVSAGNPAVWWTAGLAVGISMGTGATWWMTKTSMTFEQWQTFSKFFVLWAAYIAHLLPFAFVQHSTFAHHYLPSLEVGCLITGLSLQFLLDFTKAHKNIQRNVLSAMCILFAAVFLGFVFFSPWTYGFGLTRVQHMQRRWIKKWIFL